MVLNYIWIAFFAIAFLIATIQLIMGNPDVFPAIMNSTFESAKTAFEISLGLTGVLSLWMGIMNVFRDCTIIRKKNFAVEWFMKYVLRYFI